VTHFVDLTFHDYGTSDVAALQSIERHPGWAVVDGWPSVWIVEAVASGTPGSTSRSMSRVGCGVRGRDRAGVRAVRSIRALIRARMDRLSG
jgi:hypothetical protein